MRNIKIALFALCLSLAASSVAVAAEAGQIKEGSVEWYRLPENKAAMEAKIAECDQKPQDERKADELCRNAKRAQFLGPPYEKVREPRYGF